MFASTARADVSVPPRLQAQLIAKVASFDRNFGAKAARGALVMVVQKASDSESVRVASAVVQGLSELPDVGGQPRAIEAAAFTTPANLALTVKSRHVSILYLSTGLEAEVPAIAAALIGTDVLTFGASGLFAERGLTVGFDLESSRPKLVVNLKSAKQQGVALKAELLKFARIVGPNPG